MVFVVDRYNDSETWQQVEQLMSHSPSARWIKTYEEAEAIGKARFPWRYKISFMDNPVSDVIAQ
jgi:hypothetical protein